MKIKQIRRSQLHPNKTIFDFRHIQNIFSNNSRSTTKTIFILDICNSYTNYSSLFCVNMCLYNT